MQTYELTYIIADSVTDDGCSDVMQGVTKELEKHGAVIMKEESWGRRKLAYPIKKSNYGTYVTLQTHLEGGKVKDVDRFLRLNEHIIRHLMLVAVHAVTKPTDEAELAQALDKRVEETVSKKAASKKSEEPVADVVAVAEEEAAPTTEEVLVPENLAAETEVPEAPKRTRKPKAQSTEEDKKAENEAERKKLVEEKLNEILGE